MEGQSGHPGDQSSQSGHPGHAIPQRYAETPLVVTWEVSQACDLVCDHCRADANPDRHPDELTTEEARMLFQQVADFGTPGPFLVLSGGDPLKRSDIFELLETAVDVGIAPAITPATTPLLDRAAIEQFADIGVRRMALSLDGATAETHDSFRGESGTFETTMEAAATAKDVGLPIQFNTTVTASTVDELPAIATLIQEYDVAMWEVFFLVPLGRGTELGQISPDRARDVMRWLYRHSRDAPYRVITVEAPFYRRVARNIHREEGTEPSMVGSTGAGNGFVFVSHTGEVYPSGFLPLSAGNVREESLVSLYRDADLFNALRDRSGFSGPCGDCVATEYCGGSRSRAYATTGDPLASDPLCPWATRQSETTPHG